MILVKILIVGAGASGLVLAIKLKMNRPELDVLVLEKNNKVGKKLLITGMVSVTWEIVISLILFCIAIRL